MTARLSTRVKTLLLPTVLILLIYLLYTLIPSSVLSRREAQDLQSSLEVSNQKLAAATTNLEDTLANIIEDCDFARKGERVEAFANLAELLTHEQRIDSSSFRALLQREFPWRSENNEAYVPWQRPQTTADDTGIVICAGSSNIFFAAHLIRSLRNVLKSTLPIEIAFAGEADLGTQQQQVLQSVSINIKMINLLEHFDESITGLSDGKYAQKPFAVIASRFKNVILVDADVVFLRSPHELLDVQGFRQTGTLFYHDRAYTMAGSTRLDWVKHQLAGKEPSHTLRESLFWKENLWQEMESGVVVVDKARSNVYMSLLFSAWMNTRVIRETETYTHVLGDKETYWLAAELSSTPYHFQPDYAGIVGTTIIAEESAGPQEICSSHIAHMDSLGQSLLWFNGGLRLNKAHANNNTFATLTHYMTAGTSLSDQPLWHYDGDEVWCAEGRLAQSIEGKELLKQIIEEAKEADDDILRALTAS